MTIVLVQQSSPVVTVQEQAPGIVEVSTPVGGVPGGQGPTTEQIEAAVAAYLTAHPPAPGANASDAQVEQAVTAYLIANPPASGLPGDDATPEQIATAVAAYLSANPPAAGADATPEQISQSVSAYLTANPPPPGAGATPEQIAAAVADYLTANPPDDGQDATPEQIAAAVDAYLQANPPAPGEPGDNATDAQVASAVSAYLTANPPPAGADATPEQVTDAVADYLLANPPAPGQNATPEQIALALADYFTGNAALRESDKGANNGVATLDASGGLVQRMKIAAGNTPGVIRDTVGEGNGKSSLYPASIATNGATAILIKTGVWQSELDYAFRVFGTTSAGVVNLSVYRSVVSGAPVFGYMNNGNVPVTVTFGSFADGYSGWGITGDFGRAQFVVTDAAVVGNGTNDAQVRRCATGRCTQPPIQANSIRKSTLRARPWLRSEKGAEECPQREIQEMDG